jgi:hypothetical protein
VSRTAFPSATRETRPPARWASLAAHLVPLTVLPSGLWRIALALGFSMGMLEDGGPVAVHGWLSVYVLSLSVVSEGTALLTLGLVRPWGERVPAWVPRLGGRRIPPRPVVVIAAIGAVTLAAIWGYAFRDPTLPGIEFSHPGWYILIVACYAPLLLWAPLLAAVTYDYHRRHATPAATAAAGESVLEAA